MNNNTELIQIIERILKGEVNQYETLIHKYQDRVFMILSRFAKSETECNEWMHDVFVMIYQKLNQYQGKAPFENWLSRITIRFAYQKLLKNKNNILIYENALNNNQINILENINIASNLSNEKEDNNYFLEILHRSIQNLPNKHQWIIKTAYLDKISLKEISKSMGWSYSATKVKAFRAKQLLKKEFSKNLKEAL